MSRRAQLTQLIKFALAVLTVITAWPMVNAQELRTHRYQVSINPELTNANVNICFSGEVPEYLVVDYRKATKNLLQFPKAEKGFIEFHGRYWMTKSLAADSCVHYRVDISEHLRKRNRVKSGKAPLSFQTDNTWLWLPEKLANDEEVEIEFQLPDQYRVSSPWVMLDDKGHKYRLGKMPHDWGFTIIIGDFQLQPVKLSSGDQLNLAVLNQVKQKSTMKKWVADIGEALAEYLGRFPFQQVQVVLIENSRFKKGPVPWGDVKRGGGFGIRFVIDSDQPVSNFYADWTATHEFSHLLIPNMEYQDGWLSEGLASYLQYVLMARSNEISQQQAWQKLYLGFNRGLKGTRKIGSEQLIDTAENRKRGYRSGRTMRIYWSGAVYFLTADVKLRQQTDGKMGLPDLLLKLNRCCLMSQEEWSGIRLARKLDELSNTKIFETLYQETAYSKSFPEFQSAFSALGIKVKNDIVTLDTQNDYPMRDDIMSSASQVASLTEK